MGCQSSKSRIDQPDRLPRALPKPKDTQEEDEKAPEKYVKSSFIQNDHLDPQSSTKQQEQQRQPSDKNMKTSSTDLTNPDEQQTTVQRFDLFKGLEKLDSMHNNNEEDWNGKENNFPVDLKLKISEDQHRELLKFVEERRAQFRGGAAYLYENLLENLREHEQLAFFREELRIYSNDIENSLEDLKSHWFPDHENFFGTLEIIRDLIQKVSFEFGMMQKNIKTYEEVRRTLLDMLIKFDPMLPSARMFPSLYVFPKEELPQTPNLRRKDTEPSVLFVPKEDFEVQKMEEFGNYDKEFNFDLRVHVERIEKQEELKTKVNSSKQNTSKNKFMKYLNTKKQSSSVVVQKIAEEIEKVNEDYRNWKECYLVTMEVEKEKMKGKKVADDEDVLEWKRIEGNLLETGEVLKKEMERLEKECGGLTQKMKEKCNKELKNGKTFGELESQMIKNLKEVQEIKVAIPQEFEKLKVPVSEAVVQLEEILQNVDKKEEEQIEVQEEELRDQLNTDRKMIRIHEKEITGSRAGREDSFLSLPQAVVKGDVNEISGSELELHIENLSLDGSGNKNDNKGKGFSVMGARTNNHSTTLDA